MKKTILQRRFVCVIAVAVFIFLISCSGGGGGDGTGEIPTPETTSQLATAKSQLATGDVSGARATYETIISETTSNSEARFGRALCDILLLIEKAPSDAILAGFGQSPWRLANVFGAAGYFAQSLSSSTASTLLPFYNVKDCWKEGMLNLVEM